MKYTWVKFGAAIVIILAALFGLNYVVMRSSAPSALIIPSGQTATTTVPVATPKAVSAAPASTQTQAAAPAMKFEVVTSDADQEKGLGGRASIPHDYAMLFVFPTDDTYGFWMKDMLVPIDMIWVSDSHQIVKIDDSVSPDTYPNVFYPPQPVRYVLETRAGEAKLLGWKVGTTVSFPQSY